MLIVSPPRLRHPSVTEGLRSRPIKMRTSAMRQYPSKQTETLQDRIASFARKIREKASELPPGEEKEDFLRRAQLADTASDMSLWASSPRSQPPE